MLVTKNNQPVNVSSKLSSTSHPKIFANLREKLEPSPKFSGNMFSIGVRAKLSGLAF